MGHYTETRTFTAAEAGTLLEEAVAARHDSGWYATPEPTLAGALVTEAVRLWYAEEAGRWDDARGGYGDMLAVTTRSKAGEHMWDVRDGHSLVVPIADPADVVTRTKRVKVKVRQEQAARLRVMQGREQGMEQRFEQDEDMTLFRTLFKNALGSTVGLARIRVVAVSGPSAPKTVVTPGRMVTRYTVVTPETSRSWLPQQYDTFDTLAKARAAGEQLVKQHHDWAGVKVHATVVREDDDGTTSTDLLTIGRTQRDATVEVDAIFETVKPGAKPVEYLVGFDYHS